MSSTPDTALGWISDDLSAFAWPQYSLYAPQDNPSSQTSTPDSSTMGLPSHHEKHRPLTSTERRAEKHRAKDPNWAPRPQNPFIIFRSEFSRKHARTNKDGVKTAEKTLSKRAGEAWKALSAAKREVYKQLAEKERLAHAEKYPDYKFQPERSKGHGKKGYRRHDMVVRHAMQCAAKRAAEEAAEEAKVRKAKSQGVDAQRSNRYSSPSESTSDCSPPSSPASFDYSYSSPEPPGTPVRYSSPVSPMRSGERSSSMPSQLRVPTNFDLNPPMAPAWCSGAGDTPQSSVGWVDVKPKTYSAAYWQSLHSTDFNPLIDSPDAEFNPYTTAQSAGLAQSPSTSSVQSALGAFTYGSSEYFSSAATAPDVVPPPITPQTANSMGTATGSLPQRRRSATIPGTFPSPSSMLSSSLAHWNSLPIPPAAIRGANPAMGKSLTPPMPPMPPHGYLPSVHGSFQGHLPTVQSQSHLPEQVEMGYDRTPRSSILPGSVDAESMTRAAAMGGCSPSPVGDRGAGQGAEHFDVPAGQPCYDQAGMQLYAMGLQALGIPSGYDLSQCPDVDLSEFINFDVDCATQG